MILILMTCRTEFSGNLNVAAITDFIDGGGNLLMAASSDVSELLREVAAEVGGKLMT